MIEIRNKQYMTVIDCIAGVALEAGNVIYLANHGDTLLRALKATTAGHVNSITGPLFAYWISDRSTAVGFTLADDGFSLGVVAAADADSLHYIPSGTNMVALGGKGVAELRFFASSLDTEYASTLPVEGELLHFSADESKLCSSGNGQAVALDVAMVLENDGVSVSCIIG